MVSAEVKTLMQCTHVVVVRCCITLIYDVDDDELLNIAYTYLVVLMALH